MLELLELIDRLKDFIVGLTGEADWSGTPSTPRFMPGSIGNYWISKRSGHVACEVTLKNGQLNETMTFFMKKKKKKKESAQFLK